jgi:hypothetical protein
MHQALGKIVFAGAAVASPARDTLICQVWRDKAAAICAEKRRKAAAKKAGKPEPKGPQANFNKSMLQDNRLADFMKGVSPEKTIGILDRAADTVRPLADLAKASGTTAAGVATAAAALAVTTTWSGLAARWTAGTIGGKGMCSGINSRIRGQFGKGFTGVHADATLADGTPIEIKGPGDPEDLKQQAKELKCSPTGKLILINHESCDNEGDAAICTKGGSCKA